MKTRRIAPSLRQAGSAGRGGGSRRPSQAGSDRLRTGNDARRTLVFQRSGRKGSLDESPEKAAGKSGSDRIRALALPFALLLACLEALLPIGLEALPVQLVSARRYYTLSLSAPAFPGQRPQPYVRYQAEWRFVNWGSRQWVEIYNEELPYLPYSEYHAWADGVPLPVQQTGTRYFFRIFLENGARATLRASSLQRVLPRDPARKIDEFQDLISWGGWQPPIEDFWIVVDLGGIHAAYQKQAPAFGLGGRGPAPSLSFPQLLSNRIVQIWPDGYRSGGGKIWWHARDLSKQEAHFTLRVQWQAWYR